jgi:hypothetical protein
MMMTSRLLLSSFLPSFCLYCSNEGSGRAGGKKSNDSCELRAATSWYRERIEMQLDPPTLPYLSAVL